MLTDTDLMPFGKYKRQKMQDVPASYLLYLYDLGSTYGDLKTYIEDNKDVLEKEISK